MLLLSLLQQNIYVLIGFILGLIIAITIHECSHALSATLLGDPTAKLKKRLSLNPLAHLDPVGTIVLFIAGFGWGKPVPYNPANLRRGKIDEFLIAISGPMSNLIAAFLFAIPFRIAAAAQLNIFNTPYMIILDTIIEINLILLIFNLLPIPPLDGSKLIYLFVSEKIKNKIEKLGPSIIITFLALVFLLHTTLRIEILGPIFTPVFAWFMYLVRVFPFSPL